MVQEGFFLASLQIRQDESNTGQIGFSVIYSLVDYLQEGLFRSTYYFNL